MADHGPGAAVADPGDAGDPGGAGMPTPPRARAGGPAETPGETPAETAPDESPRPISPWRLAAARFVPPLVIMALVAVVCFLNHYHGVDWGDDFALYMRQAKALNIGNIGEVIRDNRYTVDNSGWHTFSPYLYPWGWPVLAAPVYAVVGLNYAYIKVLEVLGLCGFLFFFYDLVRRRVGTVPAVLLSLVIGLSPSYIGATDTALSDLPYLCFVGLTLWWMDRCRERGIFDCGRRRLIVLGLLIAFAFNIRREGIVLVAVLAALHLAVLAGDAFRARSLRVLRAVKWKAVLTPYATFLSAVVLFQLLLPTDFIPGVPGAGLKNASSNLKYYKNIFAENVGLKAAGYPMSLFHSQFIAGRVLAVIATLAVVGLIARLLSSFEQEIPLAAYLLFMSAVVLDSPYQEGRYLFTITPFLVYFAYQALPALASLWRFRDARIPRAVATANAVALVCLLLLNVQLTNHATRYHLQYPMTVDGPDRPAAQQMFAAVEQYSRGDDIILFFRARAMTLYTDRIALQGTNLNQMLPRVDWYVMEKGSDYSQTLLTDGEAAQRGLTKVWENSAWVIWHVPSPAGPAG